MTLDTAVLADLERQGCRLILATVDLMERWGSRTDDGRKITAEWGDATAEGWYEPVFTTTDDGKVVVDRAEIETLRNLRTAVLGWLDCQRCSAATGTVCMTHRPDIRAVLVSEEGSR